MKINISKQGSISFGSKVVLILASLLIAVAVPMQLMQKVSAETTAEINARYDAQKAALQQEIDAYNAQAAILTSQATTLQSAIAVIQNQASIIQAQIDISQAKYDQLVMQIIETDKQIKNNQDALGTTIANMYVEDNITPLEMLAGSKNIGDYLDKQEYRTSVRDELASTISKIKDLKAQLSIQKIEAERVLNDQKIQRVALESKQSEQQKLLDETKGQEVAYQQLSADRKAKVDQLRIEQAAAIAARADSNGGSYTASDGDGSRGGYPLKWLNKGLDYYVDDWGMYSRECVSYVAFKVDQAYGNMPYWGGIGMAWEWAFSGWADGNGMQVDSNYPYYKTWHTANTQTYGIPSGSTPKKGSVGVINGNYGHVAWVESVNNDGTINISHFNVNWGGDYAEWYNVDPSFFDAYIYFNEW